MRVSTNINVNPYLQNLNDTQAKKQDLQTKISSGKDILSLADDPGRMVNTKQLSAAINKNDAYLNNIESGLSELRIVSEQIDAISDKFADIRSLAVDATATGNSTDLFSLGVYVKGLLSDLVNDANSDYEGHFLFSGTKTTKSSITPESPATNQYPFEIVTEAPTESNPSGMRVVFKGNNADRAINKDATSTEVINTKAEDLFGANSSEMFEPIVELYNIMTYNADGTKRQENSALTTSETARINAAQEKIANFNDRINNVSAQNGARINRLESISTQINNEQLRLKDYRSVNEDTNVASATLQLAKEQNLLDYSLKIGTQIIGRSIFDFLS